MVRENFAQTTSENFLTLEKRVRSVVFNFILENGRKGMPKEILFDLLRSAIHSAESIFAFAEWEHFSGNCDCDCDSCDPENN